MTAPVAPETEDHRYALLQRMALDFARVGDTALLAKMVEAGMPVNLSDAKGNSLLMLASYHGHAETSRMLLEHHAEVDRRNDRGQTPLGGMAFKGEVAIVELLLEYGADLEADNGNGMTPILFASMFGRTEVVRQLRAHGASLQARHWRGLLAQLMGLVARAIRPVTKHLRWRGGVR